MNYSIYKITSPSKRVYIGQSIQVLKRIESYKKLRNWKQKAIHNSLVKYGVDNHNYEILYSDLTKEEAEKIEKDLIKTYKKQRVSLNIALGGSSSGRLKTIYQLNKNGEIIGIFQSFKEITRELGLPSDSIRKCINKKTYSIHNFLWCYEENYYEGFCPEYKTLTDIKNESAGEFWIGRKHTEESKRKQSISAKNRNISLEEKVIWCKKISEKLKGVKRSEEYKLNLSRKRQGGENPAAKKIVEYDEIGNILKIWNSVIEYRRFYKISQNKFYKMIRNNKITYYPKKEEPI